MMRVVARPAFKTRKWNPYNWLLYSHIRNSGVEVAESTRRTVLRGGFDVLHLHWPEQHLNHGSWIFAAARSATLIGQLWWTRLRGAKVVWTIHNMNAHERRYPTLERWFWRLLQGQLDGYICLTSGSRELALERFPALRRLPGRVIPHGDYRSAYPNQITREQARTRLRISDDARVLLFIGAVREYKNLPELICSFREVAAPDAVLMIAGRPSDPAIEGSIRRLATGESRVRLHLGFIEDEDLQLYLKAADAVVLPYRDILNSGSAMLALSFDRPVLMPASTCGTDLLENVGAGWMRLYEGELSAQCLTEALEWATAPGRPASPDLQAYSWTRIAGMTADFYSVLRAKAVPASEPSGAAAAPPLVSIITPCYNSAPFIADTIESVLRQDHPAIEHIVVDDGSTDGSWDAIAPYGDRVTGVRLPQNVGGCRARNLGAAQARGEYLMFLDADDTIAPETVSAMVSAIADADYSIAYCDWTRLRMVAGSWVDQPRDRPLPESGKDALAGWLEGIWVPPCAVLWRRDSYEQTGGWDEELSVNQDGDIMMRALANGARLVFAPGGVGHYRDHAGIRLSVSANTFSEQKMQSHLRVLEKLCADLEQRGRLAPYKKALGVAYQRIALMAFRQSAVEMGQMCSARGLSLGGRRAISRTRAGRLLTMALGMRRKERLVEALARIGIGTRQRLQHTGMRQRLAAPQAATDAATNAR